MRYVMWFPRTFFFFLILDTCFLFPSNRCILCVRLTCHFIQWGSFNFWNTSTLYPRWSTSLCDIFQVHPQEEDHRRPVFGMPELGVGVLRYPSSCTILTSIPTSFKIVFHFPHWESNPSWTNLVPGIIITWTALFSSVSIKLWSVEMLLTKDNTQILSFPRSYCWYYSPASPHPVPVQQIRFPKKSLQQTRSSLCFPWHFGHCFGVSISCLRVQIYDHSHFSDP